MRRSGFVLAWCIMIIGCRETVTRLSPIELHEQFNNLQTANERDLNQPIELRGKVSQIFHSWLTPHGWKSVMIGPSEASVLCHFSPASFEERLAPGQMVVIRGVCRREVFGSPVLDDCIVVEYEAAYGVQIWIATSLFIIALMVLLCFLIRRFVKKKQIELSRVAICIVASIVSKRFLKFAGILSICVFLSFGLFAMLSPVPPGVNRGSFARIEEGMTKAQVEELFGGRGQCTKSGRPTVVYWSKNGGWVSIGFLDDRVVSKEWDAPDETLLDILRDLFPIIP